MSDTNAYKLSDKHGNAVSVNFITDAVKESVQHLDGLITERSAKNLISKIDKLIGEHLDRIFIIDQIGKAVANATTENVKPLQNLIAFRAHISSKKSSSLSVSAWKEYVKKYEQKVPPIMPPVVVGGEQAERVLHTLAALAEMGKEK